jgi:hypothetical protein
MILSPEELNDARQWLMDCSWSNVSAEDIEILPGLTIIAAVDRYFEGGIKAFLRSYQ